MYYIRNYYTDELIATCNNVFEAINTSKYNHDSIVTDEEGNEYYFNVELPF